MEKLISKLFSICVFSFIILTSWNLGFCADDWEPVEIWYFTGQLDEDGNRVWDYKIDQWSDAFTGELYSEYNKTPGMWVYGLVSGAIRDIPSETINKFRKSITATGSDFLFNLVVSAIPIDKMLCDFGINDCSPEYTLQMQTEEIINAIRIYNHEGTEIILDALRSYYLSERNIDYDSMHSFITNYNISGYWNHDWTGILQDLGQSPYQELDMAYDVWKEIEIVRQTFEEPTTYFPDVYNSLHIYMNTVALEMKFYLEYQNILKGLNYIQEPGENQYNVDVRLQEFKSTYNIKDVTKTIFGCEGCVLDQVFYFLNTLDEDDGWRLASDLRFCSDPNQNICIEDYAFDDNWSSMSTLDNEDVLNYLSYEDEVREDSWTNCNPNGYKKLSYFVEDVEYTIYVLRYWWGWNDFEPCYYLIFTPFPAKDYFEKYSLNFDNNFLDIAPIKPPINCKLDVLITNNDTEHPLSESLDETINIHKDIEYIKYLQTGLEPTISIMNNWWKIAQFDTTRTPLAAENDLEEYYTNFTWKFDTIIPEQSDIYYYCIDNVSNPEDCDIYRIPDPGPDYITGDIDTNKNKFHAPSDIIVENTGILYITDGAEIFLRDGRKFEVKNGGELHVSEGRIGFY